MNIPVAQWSPSGVHDDVAPSAEARRRWRRAQIAVHVVGVFAYLGALAFALVGDVFVMFVTSFSGDAPTAGDRLSLFVGLLLVGGIASSVPVLVGFWARNKNTAALPWFMLAALTALYMFGISLNTQPTAGMPGF